MPYKNTGHDKNRWPWMGEIRIALPGGQYARRRKKCADKRAAQRWEMEERERMLEELEEAARIADETPMPSLLDWATRYLDYAKAKFTAKTYNEKRLAFKALFEDVDPDLPVCELTAMQALDHLQKQASGRSGNSANKDRKNLVAAWNWGVEYMGLSEPCPFGKVRRFAEERNPRRVPSYDEFLKVLAKAETRQDNIMLQTYLQTGARREELFRLRWDDVDLEGRRLKLIWRKNAIGEWREAWLPMQDELAALLKCHREETGHTGWVFVNWLDENRERYAPFTERNHWLARLCRMAGVQPFGLHGLRHLFASILAGNPNVPLVEIQRMLRHTSLNTTQRYVHSLKKENREVLGALPGVVVG